MKLSLISISYLTTVSIFAGWARAGSGNLSSKNRASTLSISPTNSISCRDVIEGDDVGGRFETKASFDSAKPFLLSSLTITFTGGAPTTSETTLLLKNSVCERPIDFKSECQFRERYGNFNDYEYTFKCGTEITAGEVYFADGLTNFKCIGPYVDPKYAGAGIQLMGCTLKKN